MSVGYSGTPLPRKLGIKDGYRVAVVAAPEGFTLDAELVPLGAAMDVILFFVLERHELERNFAELAALLTPAGGLWIAWPKKSSGIETDLTENVLREVGLPKGWVDNKVCAVTAAWSGLRFVRRLENR
ncbi:MAG: hypothetical protein QOE29_1265 [Gaiellaceae bacterium]|nr:hypothetical protein [Gaiellaceae bacterium]